MTSYTTHAEFIVRELHTLVSDPALYDWEAVWGYLRDYDGVVYDPASQAFHWNDNSDYVQTPRVLYDLIVSYALDIHVTEQRYVGGTLWTKRIRRNAASECLRSVAYTTDELFVSVVYIPDGKRRATVGCTHDGKALRDPDAAWFETQLAWHRS